MSEAPSVVTPQDIRDIFNRYGMNYSQIVGEENTVVSASLYTYNKAIDEIVAKINRLIVEAKKETLLDIMGKFEEIYYPFKKLSEKELKDAVSLQDIISKELKELL